MKKLSLIRTMEKKALWLKKIILAYRMRRAIAKLLLVSLVAFGTAGCQAEGISPLLGESTGAANAAYAEGTVQSADGALISGNSNAVQTLNITDKTKAEDTDSSWDAATATLITLKGTTATVSGSGAEATGGTVTIKSAGTYVVSGALSNGQVLIEAPDDDLVHLVLNGANITAGKNAAIYAASADKLVISLGSGTKNTVTDATAYTYADTEKEEPNAVIFAKCDLSINGTGSLTVNGNFKHGIATKDDLLIASGDITVNSVSAALRGKDSVTVLDGTFKLTSKEGDGVKSANADDAEKGWIYIKGGTFNINAETDGINAATDILIAGGSLTIQVSDDGIHADGDLNVSGGYIDVTGSYEGFEGATVNISGGDVNIVASDDAINAVGVSAGTTGAAVWADGAAGGANGARTPGEWDAGNSPSDGGAYMAPPNAGGNMPTDRPRDRNISHGAIMGGNGQGATPPTFDGNRQAGRPNGQNASPGAIWGGNGQGAAPPNADGAWPADGGRGMGGMGMGGMAGFSEGAAINISGGTVKALASSDCLDSNGTINISGGTVYVMSSATRDGDGIDADGTVTFTGGTIVYGGLLSTGVNPGTGSTQSYVYAAGDISVGDVIALKKDGKTLISFTAYSDSRVIALSSPEVTSGQSYDVYKGNTLLTTATAGTGGGSMMGGRGGGMAGGGGGMMGGRGGIPGGQDGTNGGQTT